MIASLHPISQGAVRPAILTALALALSAAPMAGALAASSTSSGNCAYPQSGSVSLALSSGASSVLNGYMIDVAVLDANNAASAGVQPVMVDTGSTGLALPSGKVPASVWNASTQTTQIAYSSSGNYYAGKNVKAAIALPLSGGGYTNTTPVDIIATSCHCQVTSNPPTSTATVDPNNCASYEGTAPVNGKTGTSLANCAKVSDGFGMIGVGFDRGTSPTTTNNPFLNVPAAAHAGYVFTQQGIDIGLTQANANGFQTVQLTQVSPQPTTGGTVWNGATACITLKDSKGTALGAPLCGSTLVDTGLDYMFMAFSDSARPAGSVDTVTVNVPQPGGGTKPVKETIVTPGLTMELTVAGTTLNPTLTAQLNPPKVVLPLDQSQATWIEPSNGNFINTGRHWLSKVDYLFDQSCGQIGFKQLSQ